jgi:hypothetical protein
MHRLIVLKFNKKGLQLTLNEARLHFTIENYKLGNSAESLQKVVIHNHGFINLFMLSA